MLAASWLCRFSASLVVSGGVALAIPAHAEIEKFMNQCDGKLCPFFRASITLPDGWVEDKEASDYFKVQMLLPKGVEFEKAPAKIYVLVRLNRDKKPVSTFIPDTLKDWKERAKNAKVIKLDDLPRAGGKPAFLRYQFDANSLKEQGHELTAATSDMDKDGNEFVVMVMLSADTVEARKAAEPAYLAILGKY